MLWCILYTVCMYNTVYRIVYGVYHKLSSSSALWELEVSLSVLMQFLSKSVTVCRGGWLSEQIGKCGVGTAAMQCFGPTFVPIVHREASLHSGE